MLTAALRKFEKEPTTANLMDQKLYRAKSLKMIEITKRKNAGKNMIAD